MTRVSERIGEYRIVGEIARTPGAVAYDAVHLVLPRRALIKVMAAPTEKLAVKALREPFFLESLQHPGIARVYESALLPDRRPWFARELVEGTTLATRLGAENIDRHEAIVLLRDLAEVLAHAHQRGVIHCGLRPNRVTLTRGTRGFSLCIADWADARAHDAAPVPYAPVPGGWPYAAPEQVAGDRVDDRADVFALGVIAYQLLTGALPFEHGAVAMRDVEPPGGLAIHHVPTEVRCPDAPRELTQLVDQMLALDRWDRPSAAEVRADLTWLVEALAASVLRLRKPRWTPQVAFAPPEDYDVLEIAATDDDR